MGCCASTFSQGATGQQPCGGGGGCDPDGGCRALSITGGSAGSRRAAPQESQECPKSSRPLPPLRFLLSKVRTATARHLCRGAAAIPLAPSLAGGLPERRALIWGSHTGSASEHSGVAGVSRAAQRKHHRRPASPSKPQTVALGASGPRPRRPDPERAARAPHASPPQLTSLQRQLAGVSPDPVLGLAQQAELLAAELDADLAA